MIEYHEWHGLYRESWGKTIVPAAYAHPAKFRPALIRCIYAHLLEQGYLQAGQVVLDPFAGVALGALHAMQNGLVWLGVELESRFVALGQQNIDLWNKRYSAMPGWGRATILQGDSRRLYEVLAGAGLAGAVSSPPYATLSTRGGQLEQRAANLEAAGFDSAKWLGKRRCTQARSEGYGTSDGQLASLPEGDAPQVPSAVVGSPPYAESLSTQAKPDQEMARLQAKLARGELSGRESLRVARAGQFNPNTHIALDRQYSANPANLGNLPAGEPPAAVVSSPVYPDARDGVVSKGENIPTRYGQTSGNLGNMRGATESNLAAVVSSMPFTNSLASDDPDKRGGLFRDPRRRGDRNMTGEYGASNGQIGAMREGEPPSAVVASPPWANSLNNDGRGAADLKVVRQLEEKYHRRFTDRSFCPTDYGASKGQLGAMAEGQPVQVQASVASPPFEKSLDNILPRADDGHDGSAVATFRRTGQWPERRPKGLGYGQTDGQLGTESGTTFWEASAEIMRQVYQVLAPGGYTAWVCKAFVRKGALVDFPGQWQALGESCGFETIEVIRAWLVEDNGAQWTLENGLEERRIERKSFFRLLSERRARAQKYWQSVPRADQARYLWQARHDRWDDYKCRWFVVLLSILLNGWGQIEMDAEALAERLGVLPDEISDKPTCPTRNSIIHTAQMTAYTEAGMPQIEIETAIDYEVVLIQRKVRNE